jgi:hypothetical protein
MIPQVDTFPTYKRLLSVGITDKQAEVFIKSFQVVNSTVSIEKNTNDISDVKKELAEIRAELRQFRAEFFLQCQVLEKSITTKMGGMLVIAVGVLFAMLKVFN